jgi:hypothetical protein
MSTLLEIWLLTSVAMAFCTLGLAAKGAIVLT